MRRASAEGTATRTRRSAPQSRIAPLYHQVYIQLRQRLTEGGLDPAVPLPSEPSLASAYGVSRVTIRKTLEHLQAEGLIRRVHGIGTFPVPLTGPADKANISGLLENLISYEVSTTADNLSWETAPPPPSLLASLGTEPCLRIVRLRSYLGQPISLTTLHVPQLYAGLLDPALPGDEPVIRQLDRQGVIAEQAEQVITAVAADAEAARHLGIAEQAPLIAMRRLMLDGDRRPVLHQESLYTPERFEYRMTLTRMSVGPAARWTPIA